VGRCHGAAAGLQKGLIGVAQFFAAPEQSGWVR
jgi:hypothetical protein